MDFNEKKNKCKGGGAMQTENSIKNIIALKLAQTQFSIQTLAVCDQRFKMASDRPKLALQYQIPLFMIAIRQ